MLIDAGADKTLAMIDGTSALDLASQQLPGVLFQEPGLDRASVGHLAVVRYLQELPKK